MVTVKGPWQGQELWKRVELETFYLVTESVKMFLMFYSSLWYYLRIRPNLTLIANKLLVNFRGKDRFMENSPKNDFGKNMRWVSQDLPIRVTFSGMGLDGMNLGAKIEL